MSIPGLSVAWINWPEVKISVRGTRRTQLTEDFGPMRRVGRAVLKFERGEMKLELVRRADGFLWFHARRPFSRPLATTADAVRFLRDLCEIYNNTLVPPGEQSSHSEAAVQS